MLDNIAQSDMRQLMADAKFFEGYSRYDNEKSRYETWEEAVDRVMSMHEEYYKDKLEVLTPYIDEARDAYKNKLALGAQRALQFGGEQILKHNVKLYNCTSSYADRTEFFGEVFYILLGGAGVGFSVQKHHVSRLPKISERKKKPKIHVVEDSIEGWADALDILLSSYFVGGGKHPEFEGHRVFFDFSLVRPKGSFISGGFKAPGPDGLRLALDKIELLLQKLILDKKTTVLRPIHVYDIVMHTSDAVLSGGVRRSAAICLFSIDDEEMIKAKTGNWFVDNPQRGRSNNSVVIVRDKTSKEQFENIISSIKEFGEPGFFFADSTEHTTNPCCEIGMFPQIDGKSGFQGCVSYDTKLITKDGLEIIGNVVDENREIEIWNGKNWSKVKPILTGTNRNLYRVMFSDGSYLDATDNHKFLAKTRFDKEYKEFTTTELINYSGKYSLYVPRANIQYENGINVEYAYDYGFMLGDGSCTKQNNKVRMPAIGVGEPYTNTFTFKSKTIQSESTYVYNGVEKKWKHYEFPDLDKNFCFKLKYEYGLPKEIFAWDRKSIIDFLAGWIDSDGTRKPNGFLIAGDEYKIKDCQLLLKKIGIEHCSIHVGGRKGEKTNVGIRTKDIWHIYVCDAKDLYAQKFVMPIRKTPIANGKNQIIKYITKLDGLYNSYCFEETEFHQGVFNNVLTKQCNLTEINGAMCDNEEIFYKACRAASILGTLQAGYTNFKFLSETSRKIFEREALIGCSITGFMNNPETLFDKRILKKGAEIILQVNKELAAILGINPAARTTCTKPAGTTSIFLKSSSGIHAEEFERYIRHVQLNKTTEVASLIAKINPAMVEDSVWSANNDDYVISFPIIPKKGSIFKDDMMGVKHLEKIKLVQESWIEFGTDPELCADPGIRHNVSNTIIVDDWTEISDYIYENKKNFGGISFMANTGDKQFNQAPNTRVLSATQIVEKYGVAGILASGLIVDGLDIFPNLWDATSMSQREDDVFGADSRENSMKRDWSRRFKNFASNYMNGNYQLTEHCLKDVYLLHKWEKIFKNYTPINWVEDLGKKEFVDIDTLGAIACHAGSCELF